MKRLLNFIFRLINFFENPKTKIFIDICKIKIMLEKEYQVPFGDYLEFGVYNGGTTKFFLKL